MELLTVRNLTVERHGRTLLAAVDLTLREGMRVGLVGANGSGKSTLLEVLAGVRTPTGGRVRRAPGVEVGYLPQETGWDERQNSWEAALLGLAHTTRLEREMREQEELLSHGAGSLEHYGELRESFDRLGGYAAEAGLRESLSALGIGEALLALNIGELSGGERSRLALARVMAAQPPLLLLDEPSNHLDLPALDWLAGRLRRWRGGLLIVSHDRDLLDRVSTHTAVLEERGLELSRGGYSRLREQQGVVRRTSERRERERRKEAARLEGIAEELRSWGTAKAQRRRRRVERELDKLAEQAGPVEAPSSPVLDSREVEGKLLEGRHLVTIQGHRTILSITHLSIDAGDRIALLGPNGSGKSTLLRLLAGEQSSDDPRVEFWWNRDLKLLYAGQHDRGLDDERPVLEQLESLVGGERARLLLALSGVPQESWQRSPATLSGGERARAGLARILAAEANLLLLDEPSNDLDLGAIETLQQTLETSRAALVIATHDRALARMADRIWTIEEGRLVEYRGGLEGYLAGRRRLESGLAQETATTDLDYSPTVGPAGLRRPAVTERETADDLERLELERLGVEARLDDPLRLGERERHRLEQRRRELFDLLSLAYDRRLPSPLPAFAVREGAVRLGANYSDNGLSYVCDAPVAVELIVREGVGHLTLREEADSKLLPWARGALLDAAARLAFYTLALRVVQHQSGSPLKSRLFEEGEGGWWWVTRERLERAEGWRPASETLSAAPAKRKKRPEARRGRFKSRRRGRSGGSTGAGQEGG